MPLTVDVFKVTWQHDLVIIDVTFIKNAGLKGKYTDVGTKFFHKVQSLVAGLKRLANLKKYSWLRKAIILAPCYAPVLSLDRQTVSFTVICPKSNVDYLIWAIKKEMKKQNLHFEKLEISLTPQ
ncbi:MAG: hypothetical protein A2V69_03570 [Candidatus Portnoybacteria bacterium RBG_13_40_8]|uniref:Uncharacterized protein n=1 Tax=Candidatus Portnoybacteria bacterium RBG_13_40_8 TaxID=1801990 RepID=A0A1G2F2T9_9BACT|nr:MAG: hypothetical protein A2V69_03570 [Candidatus Portnoybacteria bacterium RBG_13_40_8]